jgi:hypothetical protein
VVGGELMEVRLEGERLVRMVVNGVVNWLGRIRNGRWEG